MNRTAIMLAAAAFALLLAVSTGGAIQKGAKTITLKGYIVDQMCAVAILKKADPMARAAKHARDCSFHPECAASGFGIFVDGTFIKFDADGSAKALKALQVSKREKAMYYEVTGKMEGDLLVVSLIREVEPPK
jgi:hypothetical protein